MNARIVVVGSSNTDMVVKTERIPLPGETVLGGEFVMTAGGKGANQAVAAARLGAHVTFVARLGADMLGEQAAKEIGMHGVDMSCVVHDPEARSGVALISVDARGENCIVVASGANANLSPADVDRARKEIARADVVLLQLESPLETVRHTISLAGELGVRVILNPAPVSPQLTPDLWRRADVLTPNEVEAAMLLGWPPDRPFDAAKAAAALVSAGVGAAVVTLGAEGCVAASGDAAARVPGRPVRAVDTTAAGDCFTAALAVRLAEGADIDEACGFATAAAAISVTRLGAQASMPLRAEVDEGMAA